MKIFPICLWLSAFCPFLFGISGCVARQSGIQMGTVSGIVQIYDGNCMPSPGQPPCEADPIAALILLCQKTEKYESALLVDSVRSDTEGRFSIAAAAGEYSVFVKYKDSIHCDYTECETDCYCHPIRIRTDSSTNTIVKINLANW